MKTVFWVGFVLYSLIYPTIDKILVFLHLPRITRVFFAKIWDWLNARVNNVTPEFVKRQRYERLQNWLMDNVEDFDELKKLVEWLASYNPEFYNMPIITDEAKQLQLFELVQNVEFKFRDEMLQDTIEFEELCNASVARLRAKND